MKTILIATSKFGSPVSDYYKELGNSFAEDDFRVIYIFDGSLSNLPEDKINKIYFTWPNKRPIKIKDFIFLQKIIRKYKPILCISNFGSTNVVSIISYLLNVKNRANYIHTTTKQIKIDSGNSLKTKLLKFRKGFIYKINTIFFTNSEGTKVDSIINYGLKDEQIKVFPLLLESSKLDYVTKQDRDFSVIITGRLHISKGHKDLIYQFSNCLIKYPALKLKIVGNGFLENELKELVDKLNIDKNVIFMGRLPNNKVKEEFSKSLISISSSIDEAYGLVDIEALREGTPLVCTKTAGSIDILKEGFNGEYFDHKNEYSLCESISKIFENWEKYSKNSLSSFENNYSIDKNINKHRNRIIKLLI